MSAPPPQTLSAHPNYRSDIDGLRAVAVVSVLAFHGFPRVLSGGFVGVDIFFVISGYLISTILLGSLGRNTFSVTEFYVRRIRRIFPALLVVLAACLVASWFVLLADDYRSLGAHVAGGAAFVSNLQLWGEAGYFDQSAAQKPLLHLWSLGIEEQFYLLWPLTLWAAWRTRIRPIVPIAVILMLSFASNVWLTHADAVAAFYSPLTRFWELLVGAVLATINPGGTRRDGSPASIAARLCGSTGANAMALCGSILLVIAMVGFDSGQSFPGWRALLPTLGAALLISAGPAALINRHILSRRAVVWVGLISYPLYLWHWPLLAWLNIQYAGNAPATLRMAALALSVVLATATYRWVEMPLRFGARPRRKAVQLGAAMTAVAVAGLVVVAKGGFNTRFPDVVARYTDYKYDYLTDGRANICWLTKDQPSDGFADVCVDNAPPQRPLVVVWGDSHAARLYPGIRAVAGDRFRLAQFTRDSCPPVFGNVAEFCAANNAFVLKQIARLHADTVVLFAFWNGRGLPPQTVALRQRDTIARLQRAGVDHIIVVGPAPQWRERLPKNLVRLYHQSPYRQPPLRTSFGAIPTAAALDEYLQKAYPPHSDVQYFSAYQTLCDPQGCLTRIGNDPDRLTSWDYGHLSTAAATFVARRLDAASNGFSLGRP